MLASAGVTQMVTTGLASPLKQSVVLGNLCGNRKGVGLHFLVDFVGYHMNLVQDRFELNLIAFAMLRS
jgi:hypothetical protein